MSFAEFSSPGALINLLSQHHTHAYLVLFLGSFCETLTPLSFIIYGEVFFLAGSIMAGTGALDWWAVSAALISGGILGDHASYWLGRRCGPNILKILSRCPFCGRLLRQTHHDRGVALFQKRGAQAVFLARLAGPLSWIAPLLAGISRLDYRSFIYWNALGVLVGIGQFLAVGYLFSSTIEVLYNACHNLGPVSLIVLAIGIGVMVRCRLRRPAPR